MNPDHSSDIRSLASGMRAIALVLILILSIFNAGLASQISRFQAIFSDMLGGASLPAFTQMLIQGKTVLLLLSLLIPLAAILIVAEVRNHKHTLYSLSPS